MALAASPPSPPDDALLLFGEVVFNLAGSSLTASDLLFWRGNNADVPATGTSLTPLAAPRGAYVVRLSPRPTAYETLRVAVTAHSLFGASTGLAPPSNVTVSLLDCTPPIIAAAAVRSRAQLAEDLAALSADAPKPEPER